MKRFSWRICTKCYPGDVIQGMIICHLRGFQRNKTCTWVTRAKILDDYEVLLVPATGISKPGNAGEYPGNWQQDSISTPEQYEYSSTSSANCKLALSTKLDDRVPVNLAVLLYDVL